MKVHKSLHELFGRETTKFDLILILIGSITLTVVTQLMNFGADLSLIKKIILAFLTLDIGGGVIANFTDGTNNFYAESLKKRYAFIVVHVLQPAVLSWIFPNNGISIFTFTLFTLMCAVIVTSIKQYATQKVVAATTLLLGVMLTFLLNFSSETLHLILLIYSIKLILAFSVNWTTSNKQNGNSFKADSHR